MSKLPLIAALLLGCGPRPVGMYLPIELAADPAAALELQTAVDRWEAAGLEPGQVLLADTGAPVSVVGELPATTRGPQAHSAVTRIARGRVVFMQALPGADGRAWLHEVGHALGLLHAPAGGIMSGGWCITEATLAELCTHLSCDRWAPEDC